MASLADDNGMKGAGAKPPIATHPAFPFIVALWFAALLGLGSLLVPVPLVESLTVATGLAGIVPATAPPLGFTARALMALAFAGTGAIAGLAIARQVAKAQQVEPARRTNPVADRRPISAHDELGDEGLDGTSKLTAPRGRRAMAIAQEKEVEPAELAAAGQQDELAVAPSRRFGLTELAQEPEPAAPVDEELELDGLELDGLELAEDPLDLAELAAEPEQDAVAAEPGFTTTFTDSADYSRDNTMDDRQFFHTAADTTSQDREERQEFHFPAASQAPAADAPSIELSWEDEPEDAAEFEAADLAEPEIAAPGIAAEDDDSADIALDFSPPSLTRQAFLDSDPADGHFAKAMDEAEAEEEASWLADEPAEAGPAADGPAANGEEHQVEAASLDDLGLVQLAQRLGASIEKRREMRAAKAALAASAARQFVVAPAAAPVPLDLDPVDEIAQQFGLAAPDEAAEAMAAYFSRPAPAEPQVVEQANALEDAVVDVDEPAYHRPASIYPNAEIEPEPAPRQFFEAAPETEAEPPHVLQALAGLARIDIDDEEEDEEIAGLAASFSLPLAMARPPLSKFDTGTGQGMDEEEAGEQPDFASQVELGNPFQQQPQQFVRIEDEPQPEPGEAEPAVVFPAEAARIAASEPVAFESAAFQNQARVNSEEHERALREALLNLQRMSGAA